MNRRPLWIDLRAIPVNKRLPYLAAARNAKAEALLVAKDDAYAQRTDLAIITLDAKNALRSGPKTVGKAILVRNAADQKRAAEAQGVVLLIAQDWRVIPLENLIARRADRPGTLFARASSTTEAVLFADTLQVGAHGIVLAPSKPQDIDQVHAELLARPVRPVGPQSGLAVAAAAHQVPEDVATSAPAAKTPTSSGPAIGKGLPASAVRLEMGSITSIEDGGTGDRVCIDTTSMLAEGEGILIGGTAASMVLVLAETATSKFIAPRPFRVNAGAVSNYVQAVDATTLYLSELTSGKRVNATTSDGRSREVTVGRAKIERRPHLLVRWEAPSGPGHVVLQTAETVAVAAADGTRLAVTRLKIGDRILVAPGPAARHAGTAVAAEARER